MNYNHVLHIGPDDSFGGIGSVIKKYAFEMPGFKFIPSYPSGNETSRFIFFVKAYIKILNAFFIDREIKIVHLHSASKGSFIRKSILALTSKAMGKKTVFHIHGGSFEIFYTNSNYLVRKYIRYALQKNDLILCLSEDWLEYFSTQLKLKKIKVLGNPIDLASKKFKGSSDKIIKLLFLGKICKEKGLFDLIEFLKTNHFFIHGQIQLIIGGTGDTDFLNNLIGNKIGNKSITYLGWVTGELKSQVLNDCDVFILPSYFEGLPVSILEAMGHSKPIIATKVGGIPSIVKEGISGWLISPSEINQLTGVLDQLFANRSLLRQYGEGAYSIAKEFSTDRIIHKLNQFYTELV